MKVPKVPPLPKAMIDAFKKYYKDMHNTMKIPVTKDMRKSSILWEGKLREPIQKNVEDMVRNSLNHGPCVVCYHLGRHLCHCPLASQESFEPVYRYRDETLYSLDTGGYTTGQPMISTSRSPNSFWGQTTIPLEDIVDKWLLQPGDIEIEASL